MHEGKYFKDFIERQKLKKKDVAETLGISPQLLQGYFRSERLQDSTKSEIKDKLGIEINSAMHKNLNEPGEEYARRDEMIRSLQREIAYLQTINDIHIKRLDEKDEVIDMLKSQLSEKKKDKK